jgi:hypothetical protein
MKISITLLLIVFLISNLTAQYSVEYPPKTSLLPSKNKIIDVVHSLIDILNTKQLDKITNDKVVLDNGYLLKETIEQYWEDFGWDNKYRYVNYFDEKNNLLRGELQSWKGDSTWFTYMRAFYSYDQNNNRIEFYDQMLNGNNWENYRRHIYDYDFQDNIVTQVNQIWDEVKWNDISKIVMDYFRNNLIDERRFIWENQRWANEKHWSFKFNLNNNVLEELGQYWEGINWVNEYKWNFSYYTSQNLKDRTYNYWKNSEWNIGTKSTYSYDENDNQIESLWQVWDGMKWKNSELNISNYDESFNKIQQVQYYWRDNQWRHFQRWFYAYDINNNNLYELAQLFIDSTWRDDHAILYAYDKNNNLIERIHQFWSNGQLGNGLKYQFQYITENEDTLNGNLPLEFVLYQNFPNPFNSSTTISYKIPKQSFVSIQIYNSLGEYVASLENEDKSPGIYEVNFSAKNLPSGIYLFRLNAGKFTATKKMILLK